MLIQYFFITLLLAQEKIIEDNFWKINENEIQVIQNRLYQKNKRLFIHGSFGQILNEGFTITDYQMFSTGFYFSENWGLELGYLQYLSRDNSATRLLKPNATPNYNKAYSSTLLRVLLVPFYGKMAFFNRRILHFDFQLGLGVDQRFYDSILTTRPNIRNQTLGYQLAFIQNIFLNHHWSLRWDFAINNMEEKIFYSSGPSEGTLKQTSQKTESLINIGLAYLF